MSVCRSNSCSSHPRERQGFLDAARQPLFTHEFSYQESQRLFGTILSPEPRTLNFAPHSRTHNANYTPYPFPKHLFMKFITENDGYFPVTVEALPEGSVAYPHTPCFIITAEDEYSRLCTFLETILTMVSYRHAPPHRSTLLVR